MGSEPSGTKDYAQPFQAQCPGTLFQSMGHGFRPGWHLLFWDKIALESTRMLTSLLLPQLSINRKASERCRHLSITDDNIGKQFFSSRSPQCYGLDSSESF